MTEYDLTNLDEITAKITIAKALNESEFVTFIATEKLKPLVDEIVKETDLDERVTNEGKFIRIDVFPPKEKDQVSKSTLIEVDETAKTVFNVIRDPTILIGIIPQIKAVNRLGEDTYKLKIKWVISWDTPLSVQSLSVKETSYTVKYTASQKISIAKISFGFDFLIFGVSKDKTDVKIKEWYSGPFSSLAKGEIEKHLNNAEERLPSIIAQHRS